MTPHIVHSTQSPASLRKHEALSNMLLSELSFTLAGLTGSHATTDDKDNTL